MVYGKSNDLGKITESDKALRYKAFKTASNPKYDSYERGLVSIVYIFFFLIKISSGNSVNSVPNY